MSLSTDLFILLAVFFIANYNAVISEDFSLKGDDEENSIKQAIFLVELLKSDFAKVLRDNNYVISHAENVTEVNSTCPLPTGEVENATEPVTADMNLASILPGFPLRSDASAVNPAISPEVRVEAGTPGYVAPGYVAPGYGAPGYGAPVPGAPGSSSPGPVGPPFSNWPAMPNMPMPGYPVPPGYPQQRNFPADENYRFPYRFGRRRMMPDYYYFDAPPINPQGNYRRQGSFDPPANDTANTQPQTSSIPSTTSEVTSLHVEETTTNTSSFSTSPSPAPLSMQVSLQQSSQTSSQVSPLQTTHTSEVSSLQTTNTSQVSTLQTTHTSQESPLQTTHTTQVSTLQTTHTAQVSTLQTTHTAQVSTLQATHTSQVSPLQSAITSSQEIQSMLLAQPTEQGPGPIIQSRIDFTTPAHISKATSAIISKRKKKRNFKSTTGLVNLRQRKNTITSEKYTSEDVEMSQVASELMKELKGSPTENIEELPSDLEKVTLRKKTSKKPTMKIFLKGSSRLPVPLPENNAFCHAYPHNVLCGNVM